MTPLKKKIGPLPVWGWAAAIALGAAIYYFRHTNSGNMTGGAVTTNPVMTPTEGAFPMPSGISSGGVTPELPTMLTSGDIADAVSSQLIPALAAIPVASVPSEPSSPVDGVENTLNLITRLQDAGLIQPFPAASTGAATSTAQPHTAAKKPVQRVTLKNTKKGNPRAGQTYRVVVNPKGHPKGTYHVYKSGKYIRVKK